MNTFKLAEALGVDITGKKEEVQKLRKELGVSTDTAIEIIIEPKILERIKALVKTIEEVSE